MFLLFLYEETAKAQNLFLDYIYAFFFFTHISRSEILQVTSALAETSLISQELNATFFSGTTRKLYNSTS